jgi:hypothetical protein
LFLWPTKLSCSFKGYTVTWDMKRARNGKYVHTGVLEVVALELEYKAEE